jgi:hypothetical protein
MPDMGKFKGYKVYMYFQDHQPPHVHLKGPSCNGSVSLLGCKILAGHVPPNVLAVVEAWIEDNRAILLRNWELAQKGDPLLRVPAPQVR